jgi:hypothetical protein
MKNLSTGTGLALLAGAILAWPILDRIAPSANASAVTAAAAAVSTAATAQTGPTIVWYGREGGAMWRAWSDGRVETKFGYWTSAGVGCSYLSTATCSNLTGWVVFSDPAQGLTYRSDLNFDEKVDGADLGQLLADWGDAPRQDIPPSDCPLALINP